MVQLLLLAVVAVGFAVAPQLIVKAPTEPTMGLVQRIFYFHVPCAWQTMIGAFLAGGASAVSGGFGLGIMGAAHFGFWGTAPAEGLALGLELRVWVRYLTSVSGPKMAALDSLLTARYFFGALGVGLAGEVVLFDPLLCGLDRAVEQRMLEFLPFLEADSLHDFDDAVGTEQAHEIVLKGDEEVG